jgi:hypothetical protein
MQPLSLAHQQGALDPMQEECLLNELHAYNFWEKEA